MILSIARPIPIVLLAALALCAALRATADETNLTRQANLKQVAAWTAAQQATAANVPHLFVRRGLRADRQARTVELLAESCGLSAGLAAEFALVGETSDRDYEALARSFATPGDVATALEFIGLPRGLNISTRAQRFWPRGERVQVSFQLVTNPAVPPLPLEQAIFDRRREAPLPARGFVYCGSSWSTGMPSRCLADIEQPHSILSTYNEPQSVLDVPRLAAQGDVYDSFVVNPAHAWPADALLRFVLTPEPRRDDARVLPIAVTGVVDAVTGIAFTITAAARAAERLDGLPELLKHLQQAVKSGHDPYLSLAFEDAVPLTRARQTALALQQIEGENGIRLDAPPPGALYYRAFLPDEQWRERGKRLAQPWELRIVRKAEGGYDATAVQTTENWSDTGQLQAALTVTEFPLATLADLPALLHEQGGGLPVLLVYVPADATLASFMPAVRLVRKTHPTVYVFGEP